MIRKLGNDPEIDEKRKTEGGPMRSRHIDAETEKKLLEAGFTKRQLYNRRGGPAEKGLATLMDREDQILEIKPGSVTIKTREGTVQTFYDLEKPQDFLTPVVAPKTDPE